MDLAFTAKVRSGPLLRHRLATGLSQAKAAKAADVSVDVWGRIERLDFTRIRPEYILRLAEYLETPAEEIVPEELKGIRLRLDRTRFKQMDARRLLASTTEERLTLPSPDSEVMANEARAALSEQMEAVLKTLTFREREIIKLRYGIGDGYTHTLEEIGKIFKVTRDRIRQVEAKALRKLQHPVRARRLEQFIVRRNG